MITIQHPWVITVGLPLVLMVVFFRFIRKDERGLTLDFSLLIENFLIVAIALCVLLALSGVKVTPMQHNCTRDKFGDTWCYGNKLNLSGSTSRRLLHGGRGF